MTPGQDLILAELRSLREDLAEVKDDMKEVKAEVKLTNGRVRALEMAAGAARAVIESRGWLKPLLIGIASGGATVVVAELLRIY